MSRGEAKERSVIGVLVWVSIAIFLCLLHACSSKPTKAVQTAGTSFFPLAVGNRWVLRCEGDVVASPTTTVLIDAATTHDGHVYYHIRCDWPGLGQGGWIRRHPSGNLTWTTGVGDPERDFLRFDAPRGTAWEASLADCADSLMTLGEFAVVSTPYGRFDGVRQIGNSDHCMDAGWGIEFARGVGPVAVSWIRFAGLTRCLLVEAQVKDDSASTTRPVPE